MSIKRNRSWVKSAFNQFKDAPEIAFTPAQKEETPAKVRRVTRSKANKPTEPQTPIAETVAEENHNWIDRFAPTKVEELALHAKKVEELQNWFMHCQTVRDKHPAQMCLLTGPAGSSKTAAVRVMSKDAGYKMLEWISPADSEDIKILGDAQFSGGSYGRSQLDAFQHFLFGGSRFRSVFAHRDKRLLLVEDFPNALLADASVFEELLNKYVNTAKSPLVFIITDSKSRRLNISYNLFSDELKLKLGIAHISFNSLADTIMNKAMKRLCALMSEKYSETYKAPTQSLVDSIVVSANGDIRNALVNLHFSSLKGTPCLPTELVTRSEAIPSQSNKKKSKTLFKLKSVGINKSITLFHALGQVLNPKYTMDKKLVHPPEEIAESFSAEPKKFTDFIFANYLPHFGSINDVVKTSNDLCLADVILTEYREDTLGLLGLNVAIRSIMVSNSMPQKGWRPVHGPKRINTNVIESLSVKEKNLIGSTSGISSHVYATDYSSFVKIIAEKNNR